MHIINKKAIILLDNKYKNGIIFVSKRKAMYPHPPDLQVGEQVKSRKLVFIVDTIVFTFLMHKCGGVLVQQMSKKMTYQLMETLE